MITHVFEPNSEWSEDYLTIDVVFPDDDRVRQLLVGKRVIAVIDRVQVDPERTMQVHLYLPKEQTNE